MGALPGARRTVRGAAALAFAVAAALLISACSGSGYHYLKNSDDGAGTGTYFKIPEGWTVYDENALTKKLDLSPTRAKIRKATSWSVAFDGSSNPTLRHFDQAAPAKPFGFAEVRRIEPEERDTFSLESMRNAFVHVDDFAQRGGQLEILKQDEFTRSGGFRGLRFTFNAQLPNSSTYVTFDQVTIVDPKTEHLHLMVVSCTVTCFEREKGTINTIMDSWTVRER
jgi:hypothetical protein